MKQGYEKYDYGIYRGISRGYDIKDKQANVTTQINYMLNKSLNMFEWHGLPDSIPERELERILQTSGYSGFAEVNGELYALWGGLGGVQDAYYRPTLMTVANPALNLSKEYKLGEDMVLMRNDDTMQGITPIYAKYGTLMNENELTLYISLINKRAETIISVSDDNTAESAKQYLKNLEEGNLGYITESKLFDSLTVNSAKNNSSNNLNELIELQQYLKANLYNEIGLNANYNMKRERLNTSEVEMNSEALYPLVDNMLYNRRLAVEEINEKFGTNISVEFNSSWDYRLGDKERTGETPLDFVDGEDDDITPIDSQNPSQDEEIDTDDLEGAEEVLDDTPTDTLDDDLEDVKEELISLDEEEEVEVEDEHSDDSPVDVVGASSNEDSSVDGGGKKADREREDVLEEDTEELSEEEVEEIPEEQDKEISITINNEISSDEPIEDLEVTQEVNTDEEVTQEDSEEDLEEVLEEEEVE